MQSRIAGLVDDQQLNTASSLDIKPRQDLYLDFTTSTPLASNCRPFSFIFNILVEFVYLDVHLHWKKVNANIVLTPPAEVLKTVFFGIAII